MAQIIQFPERPATVVGLVSGDVNLARATLADMAWIGCRLTIPAMGCAVVGAASGLPALLCMVCLIISLTLGMSVVVEVCFPMPVVGRLESWWRARTRPDQSQQEPG